MTSKCKAATSSENWVASHSKLDIHTAEGGRLQSFPVAPRDFKDCIAASYA